METMSENNCPYGDDSLVIADYLAGRLSPAKTEAFEAHSFGCESCFGELQRAAELRAADQDRIVSDAHMHHPVARSRWVSWPSLAVAATVVLAIGVWYATPIIDDAEVPVEPVYRDGEDNTASGQGLRLAVERNDNTVSFSWTEIQGADQYQLRVFTESGDPVFEQQTQGTSIELSAATWQDTGTPGKFYGQVIALDELRQVIVQSDFEPL
jgi:Putative zinc-finger